MNVEPFMQALERLLATTAGLADTLALMLNDDVCKQVENGMADAKRGHTQSADEFFREL